MADALDLGSSGQPWGFESPPSHQFIKIKDKEMKVEIKEINSCKKELEIEVPLEVVNREYENAYNTLNKRVKISGFRKGKTPRKILERYYKSNIESDVLQKLVSDSYLKIVEENKIKALGQPKIDNVELEMDKPLRYTATVEILPKIEVSEYKGLEFTKKIIKVSEKDVDEELERLREQSAKFEVSEQKSIEKYDYVVISFERFINNTLDEEGKKENLSLSIGYNMTYPELERELIGMKKGEEKEIEINFPQDFKEKKIAGKEVKFKVRINEVKKRILPDLDDDFAKEVGDCNNLGELRNKLKEEIIKSEQHRAETLLKKESIDKLVELNNIEVPQILVDERVRLMFFDTQQRLKYQGIKLEDAAIELDKVKEPFIGPATTEVKGDLILDRIAEIENISVSDEEVEKRVKEISKSVNQNYLVFKQQLIKNKGIDRLKDNLKKEKNLDFLINHSKINEEIVERQEILNKSDKGKGK